jgi:hypothetical protein
VHWKVISKVQKIWLFVGFSSENWREYKWQFKIKRKITWTNLYLRNMKLTNFIGYIKIIEPIESWLFSKFKDYLKGSWIRVELEKYGSWKLIIDTFSFFSFGFFLSKGLSLEWSGWYKGSALGWRINNQDRACNLIWKFLSQKGNFQKRKA